MVTLKAKIRDTKGRKVKALRQQGLAPGVLYGKDVENIVLQVDQKEFEDVYQQVGESSLVGVQLEGKKEEIPVLVHDVAYDPLNDTVIHIDFYHPRADQEVEVEVLLKFVGEAQAVEKDGGVLVREIQSIEVKGVPKNLPREIEVDIGSLETFEDKILVKDLEVPEGVSVTRDKGDIVAAVTEPAKMVEEEEEESVVLTEEDLAGEEGEEGEVAEEEEEEQEQKED